jgi:hypothetical protein
MRRVLVAVVFLMSSLAFAAPCRAQDVPYVELSAGYNFLRYQATDYGVNLDKGLYGDVAINLNHAVGLVGVVTSNPVGDVSAVTFMGGLRFSARGFARGRGRTIGFFQLLGGGLGFKETDVNFTERAIQLGGGANVTVTDHAGIRFEVDYIRTFRPQAVVQGDNYIRFSIGVMYGFGAH